MRQDPQQGEEWGILVTGCEEGFILGFGLLLGDVGGTKAGFALLWMLSGSKGWSMTEHLHSYLEEEKTTGRQKL